MRKLKEDLDCRIHDQKLAVNIHNIPDLECFRLYFKGLVSEERVRGIMVNVAGSGAAMEKRVLGPWLAAYKERLRIGGGI